MSGLGLLNTARINITDPFSYNVEYKNHQIPLFDSILKKRKIREFFITIFLKTFQSLIGVTILLEHFLLFQDFVQISLFFRFLDLYFLTQNQRINIYAGRRK